MVQIIEKKGRNEFLDTIKGIAIILVVAGHSIQYGSGMHQLTQGLFYNDIFYKIIYSFHMPLFMMISGYLFYSTVTNHSTIEIVLNKITRLLIPVFVWNGTFYIIHFTVHFLHHQIILNERESIDILYSFLEYINSSFMSLWFLWAIFWCSLIVTIFNKFFNDNIYLYIIVLILTLIIPDSFNLDVYKYMYPYFIIAFLFRKNQEVIFSKLAAFKSIHLLLCLFCTYIILMMFFNNTSFIYLSGYTIIGKSAINQVVINFYRFIIGLVGSVLVLMIVNSILKSKVIKSRHILSSLGIYSFGIYIVSECVFVSLLPKLTKTFSPNYAITLLETLFIIIVPYFLTVLLKRFKITNRLFLGGG